jgi:nucleoside-diphosphate-sugar epimerase
VTDWPPLADALLGAAQQCGAVLVIMSNLYVYGPVDHPITERDPLLRPVGAKGRVRAEMWEKALAAHQAGRIRVVELPASDYFGPGVREQGR